MCLKEAFLGKFHTKGESRLSAETRQDGVRLLDLDDSLYGIQRQRLDVDLVGHGFVRHDGSRVGVDEADLDAVLSQGSAGLGAGVVKLGSLTDNDGAGTYYKYFFNRFIKRHISVSFLTFPSSL